jgi:hypothetical protein
MKPIQFSLRRFFLIISVLGIGLGVLAKGCALEMQNPRTNEQDAAAWLQMGFGMSLIGTGVSLPFRRRSLTIAIAVCAPFVAFMLLVVIYWAALIGSLLLRPFCHGFLT